MEPRRIFDLLYCAREAFGADKYLLAAQEEGRWEHYTAGQYIETAKWISFGLLHLGVRPGDRIATISVNRPEWNFLDMAILQVGAIHVPVYPTMSESDYRYILSHSGAKLVFVSGRELLSRLKPILADLPDLQGLYTFSKIEDHPDLSDLIRLGKEHPAQGELEQITEAVDPHETATLIYTSGTTGHPKGVMLSHHNILSNVLAAYPLFPLDHTSKSISFLPLSHVYERTNIYIYHYLGVCVYYAEHMGAIADNIRDIRPDIFTTVPRFLEKVYSRITDRGESLGGFRKAIFRWTVKLGNQYLPDGRNGLLYDLKLRLARKLVFRKWREALGGNIRVIVSGGAALQPRLGRIFTAAGLPVLEGYGLTETSPVVAVNSFEKGGIQFGTVGRPLSNVEVRIADDGEILVKGPNVMQGYYREPELTREALDPGGWFHTGDLGQIEPGGYLRITGRKKSIFKTAMGKYISPEHIENRFTESPLIDNIIVIGENQKFAAALIVPDFDHLRAWCLENGIDPSTNAEMTGNPSVIQMFRNEIAHYNKYFGQFEQIVRFQLMDSEWTVQSGEMTASLKLRRDFISKKYAEEIRKLFNIKDPE